MNRSRAKNKKSQRIVILGAGFAGLSCALELGKLRNRHGMTNFDITLIEQNDFQLFTPDLYEIASAARSIKNVKELRGSVCLNLHAVLAKQSIRFVKTRIQSVDPVQRVVHIVHDHVSYDVLVIALGSESFYFNIPGMKEHSLPFKTIHDALAIRNTIAALFRANDNVRIVICGAGAAGVELAAELRQSFKYHGMPHRNLHVTIVEGKPKILPMFSPLVQRIATRRLQSLGVQLQTHFCIARVTKNAVISTDGKKLYGDLYIWTGGIIGNNVLTKFGITLTKRQQIPVQHTLQSAQFSNVFALGDNAEVPLIGVVGQSTASYAVQTAHEAMHQGQYVAKNSTRLLSKKPLVSYHSARKGVVITLGGKHGLVELSSGIVLGGRVGWFVRKYVDFRHFKSVLPFMRACSLWYNGLRMMIKND